MELSIEKDKNKQLEKKAEMYINYLSQVFSQSLQEKPTDEYKRAKKEFLDMINPKQDEGTKKLKSPELEWDFDEDEYIDSIEDK